MTNFKKGDKVKYMGPSGLWPKPDVIYTVNKVVYKGSGVVLDEILAKYGSGCYENSYFELVQKSGPEFSFFD